MSVHKIEGKLKILGTNKKSEEIICIYLVFYAFGHFYCDVVKRKRPCCLECTKTRSPGIGTVLHWRPPDVHIFGTDPSLMKIPSNVTAKALSTELETDTKYHNQSIQYF